MDTNEKSPEDEHIKTKAKYDMPEKNQPVLDSDSIFAYAGRPFRWWWLLAKPVRLKFLFAMIITGISMAMVTIVPTVLGLFVDNVYIGGDTSYVIRYSVIIAAVPFVRSVLTLTYRYILEKCSQDLLMRLRAGVYSHLQKMDGPFYDNTGVGDLMARMTGDLEMVRHFTSYTVMTTFEQIVVFLAGSLIIFSISPVLAFTALIFAPLLLIIANKFRKEIRPVWAGVRHQFSRLNSAVSGNIAGNRVVRAFDRADYETDNFEKENKKFKEINMESARVWVKYGPALEGLANFLTIPVILVGGILVINEKMSLGGLVTFNGLLFVISNPMRMIGGLVNEIQRFSASAEKIIELLMERPRVKNNDHKEEPGSDEENTDISVAFENVSFVYPTLRTGRYKKTVKNREKRMTDIEKDLEVLKNITLRIKKGEKIGIIGATGSGKTSFINLIMRFYDPTWGDIKINGLDIKKYKLEDLRKKTGIVMQDVFLFSDTIENNIAYANPKADRRDIEKASVTAMAHEFISKMPEGYKTIVGERGVGLSGGQKQRISLARAILTDPEILILDDTTSAIDMETEQIIQKGLEQIFSDKTVFIIAHRLSSVRKADRILVFEKGEIAEEGTHSQLLEKKGLYYETYLIQTGIEDYSQGKSGDI